MYFSLLIVLLVVSSLYNLVKVYIPGDFQDVRINAISSQLNMFLIIGIICATKLFYGNNKLFQSDKVFDFTSIKSDIVFAMVSIMWIVKITDIVLSIKKKKQE